jgi:4-amino-4-deoxy-L-arabinose transferase-like glycosyltransferase
MINKIIKNWMVIAVILIAAVLRLWNLNNIPPHLTPDEAALGYNAYSILKTGRDEYGQLLPFVFKSFGDYKPGLYIYATVPFVVTLGLNEWSVRLPSALSGILSVYLVYLIIKELKINNSLKIVNYKLEIVAAFVAATNPWLIYFSRGAWEANLSLMLTLLGVYLFLRALHSAFYILPATISFALTLLAYQGAKLSTAIVVLLLVVIYWKEFLSINKKYLYRSAILGAIIATPILLSLFSAASGRLAVFSIFSNSRPTEYLQAMLDKNGEQKGDLNYFLFHSDNYDTFRGILGRYFNHISSRFLFFEGDWSNPRHAAPYQGNMLLIDALLLICGLMYVVRNYKLSNKAYLFIILWLILAPLPSVLSRDQVHSVRALNMAIPLIIVSSMGLAKLYEWFNDFRAKWLRMTSFGVVFCIWVLAFIYFADAYFVHVPKHNSKLWEYGYKEIVETVTPIQNNYKTVKVQQSFAQPYIYFLFFQKYDPAKYQAQAKFVESEFKGDVGYVEKLDNIQFVPIDWSINRGDRGSLIVGDGIRIPTDDSKSEKEFKLIKEIYYLNKLDLAFRIVEVK